MKRADYQLRHGMLGKVGSVWSRQVDEATRQQARAVTEVAGCAGILRGLDTLAHYATGAGRTLVDDLHFRFVDGNFAVLGRNMSDYTHVGDGGAAHPAVPAMVAVPTPTSIAKLEPEFLSAIVGAEDVLPAGSDWYLIPTPIGVTPVVIESKSGDMLVSGVDFTAHTGYIATRLSPTTVFPAGLVRIVAAYVDLPQPNSFVLSAPVGRRCSKYLMEYARKTQSLRAFRRAAAEYCGMYVFPEHDIVLGMRVIPGATVYTTAAAGALRIDYPHMPLPVGHVVSAGTVVGPRLELLTESASSPVSVFSRALDAGAVVSLDGMLPVKGLLAPNSSSVLLDYVEIDPISGRPHARLHVEGPQPALDALWSKQKRHELATGEFLYDQFFPDGGSQRLLNFGDIVASYYGTQLTLLLYADLRSDMEALLLRFVSEHKPAGCVMLTARA